MTSRTLWKQRWLHMALMLVGVYAGLLMLQRIRAELFCANKPVAGTQNDIPYVGWEVSLWTLRAYCTHPGVGVHDGNQFGGAAFPRRDWIDGPRLNLAALEEQIEKQGQEEVRRAEELLKRLEKNSRKQ